MPKATAMVGKTTESGDKEEQQNGNADYISRHKMLNKIGEETLSFGNISLTAQTDIANVRNEYTRPPR